MDPNRVVDVLTEAFMNNKMLGEAVFKNNKKSLRQFIEVSVLYYKKNGEIECFYNDSNELTAVSMWAPPGVKGMSIGNVMKSRLTVKMIKFMLNDVGCLIRLLQANNVLEKFHLKEPHYYLYMLGSIEKGSGRKLLEKDIEKRKENKLYWESSVTKNNHEYYRSFGATMTGEVPIFGVSNAFFVLDRR